jgi:hypothetical protein
MTAPKYGLGSSAYARQQQQQQQQHGQDKHLTLTAPLSAGLALGPPQETATPLLGQQHLKWYECNASSALTVCARLAGGELVAYQVFACGVHPKSNVHSSAIPATSKQQGIAHSL